MCFTMLKICLLLCACIKLSTQNEPLVTIQQGTLRGAFKKSLEGKDFSSFTGIPYAVPPIGELRFRPAIPAGPWEGVFNATKDHPVCPQINLHSGNHKVIGDENCLFLNVHTPQLQPAQNQTLFPVMFFIHGGAFTSGAANWHLPDVLLNEDIILVTINYRLSFLGFFCTGDKDAPGNIGLKDQNLALKWVKHNIIYFGGDPNNIIMFGQSAGAHSTHLHLVSPLSRDLINGAIIQSGSGLTPYLLNDPLDNLVAIVRLSQFTNCSYTSNEALVKCLRKLPAHVLIEQELKFLVWSSFPFLPFRPIVEYEPEGAFLTEDPLETIKSNKSAKVPIIVGVTTEEGALSSAFMYTNKTEIEDLDADFNTYAPLLLSYYKKDVSDQNQLSEKVRKFYFNGSIDETTRDNVTNMVSDALFHAPEYNLVRAHFKYTNQKVFYYVFGYRGSSSTTDLYNNSTYDYGVSHMDDLFYLFNITFFPNHQPDKEMNKIMTTLWSNFASTGNPTPTTNDVIGTTWKPVKTENYEYLFIGKDKSLTMKDNFNPNRINFWKDVEFNSKM